MDGLEGDGTAGDGMAFPGIARRGDSTRLGSGSWSRVFRAAAAASRGKGAVSRSQPPTSTQPRLFCVVGLLREEREGPSFMFTLFPPPFQCLICFVCITDFIERDTMVFCFFTVWSSSGSGSVLKETERSGKQANKTWQERMRRGEKENCPLPYYHTLPHTAYPRFAEYRERNENGKCL
jgi:hypothetical protein